MNFEEARHKCRNPHCIDRLDSHLVIQTDNGEVIESASTEVRALRAVQWLTDHEMRNNRKTQYRVEAMDK